MKKNLFIFLTMALSQGFCQDSLKLKSEKKPHFSIGYDVYSYVVTNRSKIIIEYFYSKKFSIIGQFTANDFFSDSQVEVSDYKNYSAFIGNKMYFSHKPNSGLNISTNIGYRQFKTLRGFKILDKNGLGFSVITLVVGYNKVWNKISINPYFSIGRNFNRAEDQNYIIGGYFGTYIPRLEPFFGTTLNFRF